MTVAVACEAYGEGLLGQPANTVTSLAFVAAGIAVLAGRRGGTGRVSYALLVAAVGAGSLIQHGPYPDWQAYAHDLPMAALLAFTAVDAASDLTGRRLSQLWWLLPTAAMVLLVAVGPAASTAAQVLLAGAAIGLNLARARRRPLLRPAVIGALALLAAGSLAGTLGDRTSLCRPDTLLQGHAVWHVLAAAGLWWLAAAIGSRSHSGTDASARLRQDRV
ncbi:MAG: hypothetical protein ACODAF_08435 [Actinomycetota bacterium]